MLVNSTLCTIYDKLKHTTIEQIALPEPPAFPCCPPSRWAAPSFVGSPVPGSGYAVVFIAHWKFSILKKTLWNLFAKIIEVYDLHRLLDARAAVSLHGERGPRFHCSFPSVASSTAEPRRQM